MKHQIKITLKPTEEYTEKVKLKPDQRIYIGIKRYFEATIDGIPITGFIDLAEPLTRANGKKSYYKLRDIKPKINTHPDYKNIRTQLLAACCKVNMRMDIHIVTHIDQ